jgi:hypothetical protein
MSGGGGGASFFPSKPNQLQDLIRQTREDTEQKRLESDVNDYLQSLLLRLNNRNSEKVQECIDVILEVLGEGHRIERLLFGGSVAKHTFVDGLSDIDALVILDRRDLGNKSPGQVLESFLASLQSGLTRDAVATVSGGSLAVTVSYADEDRTEIQLLPAVPHGREVCIADSNRNDWKAINLKAFHRELTRANERLNHSLIPTIKLVKSILSTLPEDIRPTGYHVESLGVEATKGYRGPKTIKSILLHVMTAASTLVLHPIADITNQSKHVDLYLGKRNSDQRVRLSRAVAGIARRMNAASSTDRWKEIIEA